jgi:hypothetical protein
MAENPIMHIVGVDSESRLLRHPGNWYIGTGVGRGLRSQDHSPIRASQSNA